MFRIIIHLFGHDWSRPFWLMLNSVKKCYLVRYNRNLLCCWSLYKFITALTIATIAVGRPIPRPTRRLIFLLRERIPATGVYEEYALDVWGQRPPSVNFLGQEDPKIYSSRSSLGSTSITASTTHSDKGELGASTSFGHAGAVGMLQAILQGTRLVRYYRTKNLSQKKSELSR